MKKRIIGLLVAAGCLCVAMESIGQEYGGPKQVWKSVARKRVTEADRAQWIENHQYIVDPNTPGDKERLDRILNEEFDEMLVHDRKQEERETVGREKAGKEAAERKLKEEEIKARQDAKREYMKGASERVNAKIKENLRLQREEEAKKR